MKKQTIIYLVFAVCFSFVGNYLHYKHCVHPMYGFELINIVAHTLIYGSLVFGFLMLKNERVKNPCIIIQSKSEIIATAKTYCEGATRKELTKAILFGKVGGVVFNKQVMIASQAFLALLMGYGVHQLSNDWNVMLFTLVVSFLILKLWFMPSFGEEMDNNKRELEITLSVFRAERDSLSKSAKG